MLVVGRRADTLAISQSLAGSDGKLERVWRFEEEDDRGAEVEIAEQFALLQTDTAHRRRAVRCEVFIGVVATRPRRVRVRRQRLKTIDTLD